LRCARRPEGVPGLLACLIAAGAALLTSCGNSEKTHAASNAVAGTDAVSVGVIKIGVKPLGRQLTVSSELVPFQQIDVYAKESGYIKQLSVDFGSRVQVGQVMAVLEIPELQLQLQQDDAAIKSASDQVTHAQHEVVRVEAQHKVLHLQFERLDSVSKSKPGLVAQQEVDDAQGKDSAAESQIDEAKSSVEAAQSQLVLAQAKRQHDQVLFDYTKITAPFAGVVTQRYANLGTLMQAGTNSSTQAMPLVRLSEDDLFRLVIPVPESYVQYIRVGDPVKVLVPNLNRSFPGKVARFAVDVKEDTRTMHTEVDVPNPNHQLIPGMYAEATLMLEQRAHALAVPLQAVNHEEEKTTVFVVNPANKIEDRQVTLGIQTDKDAEVLSGLEAGELVIVSDHAGLRPGEEVHPQMIQLMQYQTKQ
jgi:RND family efflux transporter MFP subunit